MKDELDNNRAMVAIANFMGITPQALLTLFQSYICGFALDANPEARMAALWFLRTVGQAHLGIDPDEAEDFLGHLASIYNGGDSLEREGHDKQPMQNVLVGELATHLNLDVSRSRISAEQLTSPLFSTINPN